MTRARHLGIATVTAIALAACGGGDDEASSPTDPPAADTTAPTTTPPTTAAPTTVAPTTTPTTVPPTTTPPPTTAPLTTTPPPTTAAPTVDLAQFCFDSEQALIADRLVDGMEEPDPAMVEASLRFLAFSIFTAAQSAPPEYAAQPERAVFLVDEIGEFFSDFDFDPETIPTEAIDELAPVIEEYTGIIADLQEFLSEACNSPLDTLDDQATKLRPVVTELITWELVPISNQAGDVRLLVPEAWSEWFGSDELTFDVSFLQASPDLQEFEQSWTVPGAIVTVLYYEPGIAEPESIVPETAAASDCVEVSSELYDDPIYTGVLHRYTDCAGIDTDAIVLAVTDGEASREVIVEMQFPGGADNAFVEQFLASFVAG